MKRRILALTLVLALALALMPAGVLAADGYVDPAGGWGTYDRLIADIHAETDRADRTAMLHEAEDMLMDTGCVVPLYYYTGTYAQKSYVDHVSVDGYGNIRFAYAATPDGVLQAKIATEPETLDPAYNTSVDGACLAASAFSGLYGCDAEGALVPACAESYETSADGLTYYVGLRRGLKWSDGSALTAGDFAYAWKRAARADEGYGYMFDVFEGYPDIHVEAPSDDTLVFRLKAPCAYMESLMAFPAFYPVKQSVVEADPEGWWKTPGFVCNGPFVLSAWDHYESMTYTPNPNWYDAGNVRLERLLFDLDEDGQSPEQMYREGLLDFVASPDFFPGEEEFHQYYEMGTYYAGFNAQSPIFDGKTPEQAADMRRAMGLVIDRAAISEIVGGQTPASGIVPPGMADGSGGVFREDPEDGYFNAFAMLHDPEGTLAQARSLLEHAGYTFDTDGKLSPQTPLRLSYVTNNGVGNEAVANAIRNSLDALGIEMTIQSMPWIDFQRMDKTGFDLIRGGWIADFDDPVSMLDMWTTNSGNNICSFAAGNEPGPTQGILQAGKLGLSVADPTEDYPDYYLVGLEPPMSFWNQWWEDAIVTYPGEQNYLAFHISPDGELLKDPAAFTTEGDFTIQEMVGPYNHGKGYYLLEADGFFSGSLTYTEGGKTYTIPVESRLPQLGAFSGPEATEQSFLKEFTAVGDRNSFYLVNPFPGDVTISDLQVPGAEEYGSTLTLEPAGDQCWKVTLAEDFPDYGKYIEFDYSVTDPAEPSGKAEAFYSFLVKKADAPVPGSLDNFVPVQTYSEQFEDVIPGAWYHDDVAKAYELGLVKGASATNYNRRGEIKISETIVLACRIHSIYMNDGETFRQVGDEKYYMPYVRYALKNGIIEEGEYQIYNVPATREQFAAILAHSLPETELTAMNTVPDGAIPDVAMTNEHADEIYMLYRAGVLTGNDSNGTFTPGNPIKRSEVAAIIVRMAVPEMRKTVELG